MKKGFTLIELLLVIGILVILITATIIAINPFRQFALANNASRYSGTTTIMDSVYQNVVDNAGVFNCAAGTIPATATRMADPTSQPAGYDICDCVVPTYVSTMPFDPQNGSYASCTDYDTDYTIARDATTGRITICATDTQVPPEATDICLTR
ncbi:MAG: hypothetical protein A3H01_00600 [Candidatus Wildermuthbacteria bacterium RIFCSPLOWO2_12_FULL_40_9]|uniref:Type II secretion system protein GspG C-terminal domain-containing protein n=1 Tax=Candidatus Wildermuthbacteria bacterium RIFCSPLOWO2_12_FULL_40_9 TaxID=1802467 RepID=A0A1G2RTE0_9BACT|nr:MAG: hypothetical protein A3H01_00600 [Candidatus Wildermuthbacteria bacterium RIFCSPLOWO2_12_FULL_40_9]